MAEILWHRRETRRQTENTNLSLNNRATSRLYPIPWVVPGFITTGLTILAGAPKLGKSWLILGMAWALSVGGRVFGHIDVKPCEVLFLALEDTPRRLRDRLIQMQAKGSGRLYMPTHWPRGSEAISYFDAWMLKHPNTKAIFIDTLQKVSGIEDTNAYAETYDAVARLKGIADKYGVAMVVVAHTRKAVVVDDFINKVTGSVGFTGAADTLIVMTRPRGGDDGVLSITGRDVEEAEHDIRFSPDIGTWELIGRHVFKSRARVPVRDAKSLAAGDQA
jgi:RecA-family ATPase